MIYKRKGVDMGKNTMRAPGGPGIPPSWAASDKMGVGTSLSPASQVWFTLESGIFTEIYYPHVDEVCVRDMGCIVTSGSDFFSEEKRDTKCTVRYLAEGVPAYSLVNTCKEGRYRIEKEILTDPVRTVVLQKTRFIPLKGDFAGFHLFMILTPHLANHGWGNTAWIDDYKGVPMFFAERDGVALAWASSVPWIKQSVGFQGISDGFQDLKQYKQLSSLYGRAENGNVACVGEVEIPPQGAEFTITLGFGQAPAEAANCARASLLDGFEKAQELYIAEWKNWHEGLVKFNNKEKRPQDLYRISASVLRVHEEKHMPGGIIASLSIPWGFSRSDDDMGGYHLVWTRDLVETAGGLLAAGANDDVIRVLRYLRSTQESDGHWPQNMWLDGTPYWGGIQMDEVAFPILLVDMSRRAGVFSKAEEARFWPMVRQAAQYIVCNGPVTQQDRWEEDPGYSPFTLAVEIAALLAASDMADLFEDSIAAAYMRETADIWNSHIEHWTYVTGTDLSLKTGVDGYYVRISPPDVADAGSPSKGFVPIKNRPPGQSREPAVQIISPDALALVRFGLRAASDPRIINTVKVIDALLKVDLPSGALWYRYNDDGYGEHADGTPFNGTGVGRPWPLITGERAHYELAADHKDVTRNLLKALESFAGKGGLLPEQIWDAPSIPERGLLYGRPSGSAMPLVWAHAEYIKLRRSLKDGCVFDMPPQTVERYQKNKTHSHYTIWRFNHKCRLIPKGNILRIEVRAPAMIHWSADNWKTSEDVQARDSCMGIYTTDVPAAKTKESEAISFTIFWSGPGKWEGNNFTVNVGDPQV
jgi:glucoamylase